MKQATNTDAAATVYRAFCAARSAAQAARRDKPLTEVAAKTAKADKLFEAIDGERFADYATYGKAQDLLLEAAAHVSSARRWS